MIWVSTIAVRRSNGNAESMSSSTTADSGLEAETGRGARPATSSQRRRRQATRSALRRAITKIHVLADASPRNDPSDRHAATKVSWVASSASSLPTRWAQKRLIDGCMACTTSANERSSPACARKSSPVSSSTARPYRGSGAIRRIGSDFRELWAADAALPNHASRRGRHDTCDERGASGHAGDEQGPAYQQPHDRGGVPDDVEARGPLRAAPARRARDRLERDARDPAAQGGQGAPQPRDPPSLGARREALAPRLVRAALDLRRPPPGTVVDAARHDHPGDPARRGELTVVGAAPRELRCHDLEQSSNHRASVGGLDPGGARDLAA